MGWLIYSCVVLPVHKENKGAAHSGLAIYIKTYPKEKEELSNLK